MPSHSQTLLRRAFTFVALAAVLGLSTVGLTQCRFVEDSVTGVDVRNNAGFHNDDDDEDEGDRDPKRRECRQKCRKEYRLCVFKEELRHCAVERECDKIRDREDRKKCRVAEDRRHKENREECRRAKRQCKRNCDYREGAGSGGR